MTAREMTREDGNENIAAAALLLVADIPQRALTRSDTYSDRIVVSRSRLLQLIEHIDQTYPGARKRIREMAAVPTDQPGGQR